MTEGATGYIALAEGFVQRGDLDRAADHFHLALRFEKDSMPALCGLVGIYLRTEQIGEARRVLAQAIAIDEGHPRVLRLQAELHARSGRFDLLADSIRTAAQADADRRRYRPR